MKAADRVFLVRVTLGRGRDDPAALDELAALATSAGHGVVGRLICHRPRPDPALYVGRGKAEEIGAELGALGVECVLFDHDISAVQQRNLERLWQVRVLDRTELILEIFGQRARSAEGLLQVELARLQHQASRLVRAWSHLERQRGGIGVRGGPGETQLEMDRRMLAARIRQVRERLDRAERQRRTRRKARHRSGAFRVSLVGYTNAGKSTLFNALTGAGTYAADQLFATLDTLTRRLSLAPGVELLVSDTVGFVRALPHGLIEAFRATLEETADADLLLHVVDASAADRLDQIEQVERVLTEIGAASVPQWRVWNKIDLLGQVPEVSRDPCDNIDRLSVSARTGAGIEALRLALCEACGRAASSGFGADDPNGPNVFSDAAGPRKDRPRSPDACGPGPDASLPYPARPPQTVSSLPYGTPDVDPHSYSVVAE